MILKRVGAIALAVILIGGAWLVRDQVIEDNGGSGNDDPPRAAREIVCVSDLREACDALAATRDDLVIQIENASTTLDALAALEDPSEAPIWITMAPLPAMVDNLREIERLPALGNAPTLVASSPIALVVPVDRADVLASHCDAPQRWRCVGDAAGNPWEEIGGDPLWRDVRPAFSPIETAIGLLSVADAVAGYFGAVPIQPDDPDFLRWARRLAEAVPASALTGPTAIFTIETRRSALDIAVGAAAELSDPGGTDLTLQYAEPMIRADVVVVVPEGTSTPSGLTDELSQLLATQGWDAPSTDPNPLPTPPEMFAIREAWKGFL